MVQTPTPGIAARRLTYAQFLDDPCTELAEWVDGEVVALMSVSREHMRVARFVMSLLIWFNEARDLGGEVLIEPFNIKLGPDLPGRSPDVAYVRAENLGRLREKNLEGPPDIAVEVVSPGSGGIDRGEKYYEYEAAGVPEYWLIDPQRRVAEFYKLSAHGLYELAPTADGVFHSAVLPGFFLRVAWLWDRPKLADAERELGLR